MKTQTELAVQNFGRGKTPPALVRAYAQVKLAALTAVQETQSKWSEAEWDALRSTLEEIVRGERDEEFVLDLAQGGAGTSLHMNLNEIVAEIAARTLADRGTPRSFHPIDDVNAFQSTNDTFPTAATILAYEGLTRVEKLVIRLQEELVRQERIYATALMTGRTEYQDGLPVTFGQVLGSWAGLAERDRWRLAKLKERVRTVALGGTAVGTCFSAPSAYVFAAEKHLRKITGLPLSRSQNLVDEISNLDKYSEVASGLRLVAENLFKIAGDLLYYSSSPVGEIRSPELQAGSTIMAAKTNPVILEFVQGLSIDVQGEANKISLYAQNGRMQLNAFLPFVVQSLLHMFGALEKALPALIEKHLATMSVDTARMESNLGRSPALLNALVPSLGYDRVKTLARRLEASGIRSLEDVRSALISELGLSAAEAAELLDPRRLTSFSSAPNQEARA